MIAPMRAIPSTPSPSGRCPCITRGARRTRGCARSPPPTGSTCIASARRRSASATTTGCGSSSHIGRVKAQVKLMEGVNPDTVWTWNAIGKRSGAWALDKDAPEATQGLPAQPPDQRTAARARRRLSLLEQRPGHRPGRVVRPARAHREDGARRSARDAAALRADPLRSSRAGRLRFRRRVRRPLPREAVMTKLPERNEKKLGLVIDLDTCVGCQACATSCKEWNTGGYAGAAQRRAAIWRRSARRLAQPRARLRGVRRRHQPDGAFPALVPALRDAGLRDRLPDRRLLQARRGRHRARQSRHLHRLQAVLVGLPLRRPRVRLRPRRDEEVHAVRRPHLQ